ncbi:MAG: hypothetical protein COA36_04150 [Desulfotalea sp.]|nr:MAG: hypothetical protein COA36_04150 [Desulfotalea sp.]
MALLSIVHGFCSEAHAYGNNFSCSYGKRGACLDYGDKVCSSSSKCVSSDAVCFDSYQCGYGGFVCKSKLDDLAVGYDHLVSNFKNVASERDDLVDDYNNLLRKYKSKVSEYDDFESCVRYASTLDEARYCY